MITCSVCGTQNDDLAVTCVSCKSYLQTKVDNLNLFETIWALFETPRRAMKRIVLSRHKNYVVLLSSLFGMSLAYTIVWYRNLGQMLNGLFVVLAAGLIAGPFLGILVIILFSIILSRIAHLLGGKASVRNTYAVVSYSAVPIVLSLVFVFPVEIAIFGQYFFDSNPPPLVINPVAYVVLIAMDVGATLWSWALLVEGIVVANGFSRGKSALTGAAVLLLAGLSAAGLHFL